ncbi:hypothetical protein HDU97_005647 [Phlyctochytrium planicorne]|nr:hypothetical protein HDU97_005647 [Phlyctochytrium planicorne]
MSVPPPSPVPVAHHTVITVVEDISVPDTTPYIPSLCPLIKNDTLAILSTSPDKTNLLCLHLLTGNCGWVRTIHIKIVEEDVTRPNPFIALALSPPQTMFTASGVIPVSVPTLPSSRRKPGNVGPTRSYAPKSKTIKMEPSPSPPVTEKSDNTSSSSTSPSSAEASNPVPPARDKKNRDPKWDKRYEQKRRAEGKRGHGANLLKHQQSRCTKPFPASVDALLDILLELQPSGPDAETHMRGFSERALAVARDAIAKTEQKSWRVWLPDEVWKKFNILKVRCTPPGTTVAEFVEMMMNLAGRTEGGADNGAQGANMEYLDTKRSLQLSIRAALSMSNNLDVAEDLWQDKAPVTIKTQPESPHASPNQVAAPPLLNDTPTSQVSDTEIISFLNSMENEVLRTMIEPNFAGSFSNPSTPDVFSSHTTPDLSVGSTPTPPIAPDAFSVLALTQSGVNATAAPQSVNDVAMLLNLNPVSFPMPTTVSNTPSPLFSLHDSPLLNSSPGLEAFTLFGASTPGYIQNQTLPPTYEYQPQIVPFDPTAYPDNPEFKDFTQVEWNPPQLPGQVNHQRVTGIFRYHPYELGNLRNMAGGGGLLASKPALSIPASFGEGVVAAANTAALDAIYIKQDPDGIIRDATPIIGGIAAVMGKTTQEDGSTLIHWASLYGPLDWKERVQEPPPPSVVPDTLELLREMNRRGRTPSRFAALMRNSSSASEDEETKMQSPITDMSFFDPHSISTEEEEEDHSDRRGSLFDRAYATFASFFATEPAAPSTHSQDDVVNPLNPHLPKGYVAVRKQSAPAAMGQLPRHQQMLLQQKELQKQQGGHVPKSSATFPAIKDGMGPRSMSARPAFTRSSSEGLISDMPFEFPPTRSSSLQSILPLKSYSGKQTPSSPLARSAVNSDEISQTNTVLASEASLRLEVLIGPKTSLPRPRPLEKKSTSGKLIKKVPLPADVAAAAASSTTPKPVAPVRRAVPPPGSALGAFLTAKSEEKEAAPKEAPVLGSGIDEIADQLETIDLSDSPKESEKEKMEPTDVASKVNGDAHVNGSPVDPKSPTGPAPPMPAASGIVALMNLLRPFSFPYVLDVGKTSTAKGSIQTVLSESERGKARVTVTVGIIQRLEELGRIDESVVTAGIQKLLATYPKEIHPAALVLISKLVATGLVSIGVEDEEGDGEGEEDEFEDEVEDDDASEEVKVQTNGHASAV